MKKPKKRGRKPGVKVGPYRTKNKPMTLDQYTEKVLKPLNEKFMLATEYSPAPILTLCGQLEDSVMLLENRISNVIAKINSLM